MSAPRSARRGGGAGRALGLLGPVAAVAAAAWQGWPAAWVTPPRSTGRRHVWRGGPRALRRAGAAGRDVGLLDLDARRARTIGDVEVGDVMQGTIVGKGANAIVRLDVGLEEEVSAFLVGAPGDLRKLRIGEELGDLRVEFVNTKWNEVDLSFVGLSDLVAGRELRPPESFKVGDLVDGQVAEHLEKEILIDIGAGSMAYMRVPNRLRFLRWLEVGETLNDLTVEVVNAETGMIQVMLPLHDLHDIVAGRAASLTDFQEGDVLDGTVTRWNHKGLYVDVGCFFEALLQADKDQMFRLKVGDQLRGLKVLRVDMRKHEIVVIFPGLRDFVAGRGKLLSDVQRDTELDGTVVLRSVVTLFDRTRTTVCMLDVDCDKLATLVGPEQQVLRLRKGDVLQGLKVVERRRKVLYVECPDLGRFVADRREPLDIHEFDVTAGQALARKALGHRIWRTKDAEEKGRGMLPVASGGSSSEAAGGAKEEPPAREAVAPRPPR